MKLPKFKNLLAHTISLAAIFSPALGFTAIISNYASLASIFFGSSILIPTQVILLMYKATHHNLDSTALKFLEGHFWKGVLDKPGVMAVQRKQDSVMIKLRRGIVDQEVLDVYTDYKTRRVFWQNWMEEKLSNASSRTYKDEKFYVSKSDVRNRMNFRFDEIIQRVEKLVPDVQVNTQARHLNLKNFAEGSADFIMKNYGPLKKRDYEDLKAAMTDGRQSHKILSYLAKHSDNVDWTKVRDIVITHYKSDDALYDDMMSVIDNLGPKISNKSLASNKWPAIQENYEYLVKNKKRIDAAAFQEFEQNLAATRELLSGISGSTLAIQQLIDSNTAAILEQSADLKILVESSIIKDLSINQKTLTKYKS